MAFYDEDLRIGSVVFVNGINAYDEYNADLIDYTPVPGKPSSEFYITPGGTKFNLLSYDSGQAGMAFSFYVGGESDADAANNVSRLLKVMEACVIEVEDDPLEYVCVMQSCTDTKTGVESYRLLEITFACIKRSKLKTKTAAQGLYSCQTTIKKIGGTEVTGLRLRIVCNFLSSSGGTVQITGLSDDPIEIKNCVSDDELIVDGIDGVITRNGVNCMGDSNLFDFPKAAPGSDVTIKVQYGKELEVSWYERYK